jgi:hypothetical protein
VPPGPCNFTQSINIFKKKKKKKKRGVSLTNFISFVLFALCSSDGDIVEYAGGIICTVKNWGSYLVDSGLAYLALETGGPDISDKRTIGTPFMEGIIFVSEAAAFGSSNATISAFSSWQNRSNWANASFEGSANVTGQISRQFLASFVTEYPMLLEPNLRLSRDWQADFAALFDAHLRWTAENSPYWGITVFSAGTTKSEWGGYSADSLSNHPGNISHFPALLAFLGAPEACGINSSLILTDLANSAEDLGARSVFSGSGLVNTSEILYRRSNVDAKYLPDSAGLPDVAYGAIGLASYLSRALRLTDIMNLIGGPWPTEACSAKKL